jgi:tRNA A-37 threonylcarbamoyl transferase component Bud32
MAVTATFLEPGTRLGKYRIGKPIGCGGMAIVYIAEQEPLHRDVALKVIPSTDEEFRRRVEREALVIAALEHPNIIGIHEYGEEDGWLFLAMKLVRGENLAERMHERPLSAQETVRLLTPIADALDAAHRAGIVHRDVKPQNILIDGAGRPYLADFGIAKGPAGPDATDTRGFVGTDMYAAPEQITGLRVTPATDVYSLTAVLYHCLAGRPPYAAEHATDVLSAHVSKDPPGLAGDHPWASGLNRVIARGMAKRPQDRFQTASELMRSVSDVIESRTPSASLAPEATTHSAARPVPAVPAARPRTGSRRRGVLLGLGGVAVLVVLVAVGLALPGSSRRPTPPKRFSVRGGMFTINYARPWHAVTTTVPGSFALSDRGLGPAGIASVRLAADNATLAAGPVVKSSLIPGGPPPTLVARFRGGYRTADAQVAGHAGRAYTWSAFGGSLIAYVLPTWAGDSAIICQGQSSPGALLRSCNGLARDATISDTRTLAPGPDRALAHSISGALTTVEARRSSLKGLRDATLTARASKASALAGAEHSAASALATMSVPTRYRSSVRSLRVALVDEGAAFRSLATAARADNPSEYSKAVANVHKLSRSLADAASALKAYQLEVPALGALTLDGPPPPPPVTPPPAGGGSGGTGGSASSSGNLGGSSGSGGNGGTSSGGQRNLGPS